LAVLSNSSQPSLPGKVKRKIAAWSVGAMSVVIPLSNRTP
jgi:hypothetical protein